MAKRSATTEFRIGPFTVILDTEDVGRASKKQWKPIEGEFVTFVTDTGTLGNPAYRTLGQLILSTDAFVDMKDRSFTGQLDYRRKNLKIS